MALITQIGVLKGHGGWVTAIATPASNSNIIVSASRDKSLIKWDVSPTARTSELAGRPIKSLTGHSDFINDVQISSDGFYALSGSSDKTLGLWDLRNGNRRHIYRGHTNDVLSVAFSPDNRQIVSASRDHSVRVWNTIGEQKYTFDERNAGPQAHSDWVTCVRVSRPTQANQAPVAVSGGYDGKVKVWRLGVPNWAHQCTLDSETGGYISAVCISPDGSLCASGGKEGVATLWDLNDQRSPYSLGEKGSDPINALGFCPTRFWLTVATLGKIKVYDLESRKSVADLIPHTNGSPVVADCRSLAWSADGTTLYAGFSDNLIRVWQVSRAPGA